MVNGHCAERAQYKNNINTNHCAFFFSIIFTALCWHKSELVRFAINLIHYHDSCQKAQKPKSIFMIDERPTAIFGLFEHVHNVQVVVYVSPCANSVWSFFCFVLFFFSITWLFRIDLCFTEPKKFIISISTSQTLFLAHTHTHTHDPFNPTIIIIQLK